VDGITLFLFGGVARTRAEAGSPGDEFWIAFVGPLMSVAIGAAMLGAAVACVQLGVHPGVVAVLQYIGLLNIVLAVFNMLPGFPLDGGRVLRAILWSRSGDLMRATTRATRIGRLLALALIAVGVVRLLGGDFFGLWLAIIGWFIMQAGSASLAQVSLRHALGDLRVRDIMATEVRTVPADATVHDLIEGYFIRYTYGGYPVVKDGRVVGLVTLRELRNTPIEGRATTRVEHVMVPLETGLVVDPATPVVDALDRMMGGRARRLVVLERDRLVGLITANGILHLTQVRSSLGA
jgi:CBS domain-containing protein